MTEIKKPLTRSAFRKWFGAMYYTLRRKLFWVQMRKKFARSRSVESLPFSHFTHRTILLRTLKNVDMWMQYNKIVNLKIAVQKIDKIIIRPGEIFSYWRLIGKPTRAKGYLDGMILKSGTMSAGVGGGLCQLSNLIFWMTLHTPLDVIERHRHGYDVFPDSNRTQPFGSGATCFYPHGDLMIKNNTPYTFCLSVRVGDEYLEGEWTSDVPAQYSYEIVERNHEMRGEYWGGYSRHNELYRRRFDLKGRFIDEMLVVKNSALMMYPPFLSDKSEQKLI